MQQRQLLLFQVPSFIHRYFPAQHLQHAPCELLDLQPTRHHQLVETPSDFSSEPVQCSSRGHLSPSLLAHTQFCLSFLRVTSPSHLLPLSPAGLLVTRPYHGHIAAGYFLLRRTLLRPVFSERIRVDGRSGARSCMCRQQTRGSLKWRLLFKPR